MIRNFCKPILLCFGILFYSSCSENDKKNTDAKAENKEESFVPDSASELKKYDLTLQKPLNIKLPSVLKEISGITFTSDGKLFAQQDESGIIYQVDKSSGEIIKAFSIGNPPVRADFEDIEFADGKFYLLSNNGTLYNFSEGADKEAVEFEMTKTNLKSSNDAEGLSYDPDTKSLLIALKGLPGDDLKKAKSVYSFSLDKKELNPEPRFILYLSELKKVFNPSGIRRHPVSGSFFIIAANGNEILEISKEGKLLNKHELSSEVHKQPEGIAFDRENNMYISNEGKGGKGYIVVYPYKK